MMWYDPLLIIFALIGILMMLFNNHNKHMFHWGLMLLILALIAKAFLWFESVL